jgi:hypothetical protein
MGSQKVHASKEGQPMPNDQEFLLYPLDTGEDPECLDCAKPDFITFRCKRCGRSEKYVCEE